MSDTPPAAGPVRFERWLARGLAAVGALVCAAGALSSFAGGVAFRVGPVPIGLQRPARSMALGLALVLVSEAFRRRPGGSAAWRAAALVALLGLALAVDSPPRLVGDAHEYVAMAENLSAGRGPALTDGERRTVEAAHGLAPGLLDGGANRLVARDGRQEFLHFWAYPLLAAPFVAVLRAAGGSTLHAFALLNLLLLAGGAAVVARRAGVAAAGVLFASPLLWWADKAHPEVLFVSALAAAAALAASRPAAAVLLSALPALQNPAFVPVLACATAWAWARRPRPQGVLLAAAAAWATASLNPLYYLARLGRPSPLAGTAIVHAPGVSEVWALLGDANIGLLSAWPAAALLALGSAAWALARLARSRSVALDVLAVAFAAASLLAAATQAGNVNHGGTRGVSRYAIWVVPAVVPALAALGRAAAGWRSRGTLVVLGTLSLVSLFPGYVPGRPERYLSPTPLAAWLWTRRPGAERPLPEVFAERSWGRESTSPSPTGEPLGVVPAATPRCETALLRGDGTAVGAWPLQCVPSEMAEACRPKGALCYAVAHRDARRFHRAPEQPAFAAERLRRWYWASRPDAALARAVTAAPWADMGAVDPADEADFIAARHGSGRLHLVTTQGGFAVWFDRRRQEDAWVEPRVLRPATAVLLDPLAARELARERLAPRRPTRIRLPDAAPLLLVVVED